MDVKTYRLNDLPVYLQDALRQTLPDHHREPDRTLDVLDLKDIQKLTEKHAQWANLLLHRHHVTNQISTSEVLYPPLILERARTYQLLGYSDLAAADAYIALTLCETVRNEEWVSDLEPRELSGEGWPESGDMMDVYPTLIDALAILYQSLVELGATEDASNKYAELLERYGEMRPNIEANNRPNHLQQYLRETSLVYETPKVVKEGSRSKFGMSRREIYSWNEHEPDRNSPDSVKEINDTLSKIAPNLEARVTALPALNNMTMEGERENTPETLWYQLGLFAKEDLLPGTTILQEKSILTAIRPLDDALCDACGVDLESLPRESVRQCPGDGCDTTFCSDDCASLASTEYHRPNLTSNYNGMNDDQDESDSSNDHVEVVDDEEEEEDGDYPPSTSPFCNNTALQEIGRTTSTTTPEWDLYFLLLTRTLQMSITRDMHPLDLPEIKYLWGDFDTASSLPADSTTDKPKNLLPFSLYHNISLPLQYHETLMHSLPTHSRPYTSTHWLDRYDWWVVQTLYAKFRGVANAQQSTYDGKPEIAAVHPMWCLANHSCAPNVRWTPTGLRTFKVLTPAERIRATEEKEWTGIKKGEEIWSHYTDVRLSVDERREKLREVLGGICRCSRCMVESSLNQD